MVRPLRHIEGDAVVSTFFTLVMKLLIGIVLFAGLPVVGWGVTDLQGFMEQPARLAYVVLVILLQVVVVIKVPAVGRQGTEGKRTVRRQRVVVLLLQVLSLAIVIAAPYSDRRGLVVLGDGEIGRYLGLIIFALGFTMMNWAEASLGKQFSVQVTIQDGHQLVTAGPYRYLRHPRYSGIIIYNVGISLVYRSGLALILVAAFTLVLLWRIHDEEELMRQTFGAEWEGYSRRSSRLIPFVY